ncbi:hypothetical protein JOC75_000137 [Metabacillus crassostreae]|nr:hypothetical protein [Metabacillus crassostreae]
MFTKEAINNEINKVIANLNNLQNQDGSWNFCFEDGGNDRCIYDHHSSQS